MELLEQKTKFKRFILPNGKHIDLWNEDCFVGLDSFGDQTFSVIVTSPPYNLGIRYNDYNDMIPREQYLNWLEEVSKKLKQKMKDDGSFFLNIGSAPSNPWGPFEIAMKLRPLFALQNTIHWIKSIYIENESYGEKIRSPINIGHYKPIPGTRFLNDSHEYIFHFTKNGDIPLDRHSIGVPYKDSGNIVRWKNGHTGIRCRGNTWYIPYKTIQSRDKERPHPATFPPELAEMCIRLHGLNKDSDLVVLDPFMGLGHTSLACKKLGLNCIGFEIDEHYFKSNTRLLEQKSF